MHPLEHRLVLISNEYGQLDVGVLTIWQKCATRNVVETCARSGNQNCHTHTHTRTHKKESESNCTSILQTCDHNFDNTPVNKDNLLHKDNILKQSNKADNIQLFKLRYTTCTGTNELVYKIFYIKTTTRLKLCIWASNKIQLYQIGTCPLGHHSNIQL